MIYSMKNVGFSMQKYKIAINPEKYLLQLLTGKQNYYMKSTQPILSLQQFRMLLVKVGIELHTKQIHQTYLYATFESTKKNYKKKFSEIISLEKKKIDLKSVARWLRSVIDRNGLKTQSLNAKRSVSEYKKNTKILKNALVLPALRGTMNQKLQNQLQHLIEIFQQMQRKRQNSGLIPVALEDNYDEVQIPSNNIPYDPELHDLNNNLTRLKIEAQNSMSNVIDYAKDTKKIKKILQKALQKFQNARIQANEKVGRMGAMKAQRRLIENKKKQMQKYDEINLGQQQSLLKAAHLYSLMFLPEKDNNKIIL